jgi:hypothetical protein
MVALGIAGEFVADGGVFLFSRHLQTINDGEYATLNKEAGDARRDAGNANKDAGIARKDAADATKDASDAKERAAKLEVEAGTLRKRAEDEAMERAKIQKQLAPRTLTDANRAALGEKLRSFSASFKGRKVTINSYASDAEGIVLSLEILDTLTRAGIDSEPVIGRLMPVGLVTMGVKVTGPSADEAFIRSLVTGIRSRVDTELDGEWGPKYPGLTILVGEKPVAGLPNVTPTPAQ